MGSSSADLCRPSLSKLERTPLREAWKHEANDFTPWLAEEDNLNTLADALGLADLELVVTENRVSLFKYSTGQKQLQESLT